MNERQLKSIIDRNNLKSRELVIQYINANPENLSISELSRIAELVNNSRVDTAAYYTDQELISHITNNLPDINKDEIRILEPSCGVANFVKPLIEKYSKNAKKLIIDINDLDYKSILVAKTLIQKQDIPKNVTINYLNFDFLSYAIFGKYDLVVGNPPFLKLNKKNGLAEYSDSFDDYTTKNLAGFFLQKACELGENVCMIMPKYFLSNNDFEVTRKRVSKYSINRIDDFGEKGFKGVLIETIAIYIKTNERPTKTLTYSITRNIENIQMQKDLTDSRYPYWLIYRNDFFNKIASKMKFNVFTVFRDRQLSNSKLTTEKAIRVLKSRNIKRDGTGIIDIENYDRYVTPDNLKGLTIESFLEDDQVYLTPNMTYYPRVIKKPKGYVVNGSIAILIPKEKIKVSEKQRKFLCSSDFEKFYAIARNYGTRSLNIDKNSVFFFGLYK